MRKLSFAVPLALAAALICTLMFLLPRPATAMPSDAKRTGKKCDLCHVTMTSKQLTMVGLYYQRKRTLVGAPIEEQKRAKSYNGPSVNYKPKYNPDKPTRSRYPY